MRTETPVAVRLSDYTPYPFSIDDVRLEFRLDPGATQVRALLKVTPAGSGPMRLDGEALTLKSIRVATGGGDLAALSASAYTLDEHGLTLNAPPTGTFTLETVVEISPEKNTALSGLYMSGGRFCTQWEVIGYLRNTFYHHRPRPMCWFRLRPEEE